MSYNWQQEDWPEFIYQLDNIEDILFAFSEAIGHMTGVLKILPETLKVETMLDIMVAEAIKTSEIEGEYLSRPDVMSSIRNNLGLNKIPEQVKDRKARGAGELMVAVRNSFEASLSEETIFHWHRILMNDYKGIITGAWRTHTAPMQVISGAIGKEIIHFEAPPSEQVPMEMKQFISWFNDTAPGGKSVIKKAPVRAAIAHLYFESIHPFEDGNGRIGRAIAEKALSQTVGRPILLSLSQAIELDKKSYYRALESAQKSNEISNWIAYFVSVIGLAQQHAKDLVDYTLEKTAFLDRFKHQLNERQFKAVLKMLDAGPGEFEGGMTAKKYISITKTSKATATRDLQQLKEMGAFQPEGGGRSIHYSLNI